jgi:hypothetical protein
MHLVSGLELLTVEEREVVGVQGGGWGADPPFSVERELGWEAALWPSACSPTTDGHPAWGELPRVLLFYFDVTGL